MISEITMTDYCGTIHMSSDISISKYQFMLTVADIFDLDKNLIKEGTSEDLKLIAKRPKNLTLSNLKAKRKIKTPVIPIKESLNKMKKELLSE